LLAVFVAILPFTSAPSTHAEYPLSICPAAAAVCPEETVEESVNVPVTFLILPALFASPTLTVTPSLIFPASMFDVVTAWIVCLPVRYVPDAIV
jgi:hypothetical protein